MLKQRVLTALGLGLGFLVALLLPPLLQMLALSVFFGVAMWEFLSLSRFVGRLRALVCVVFVAALFLLSVYVERVEPVWIWRCISLAATLWAVNLLWLLGYPASAAIWARQPLKLVQALILLSGAWCGFSVIITGQNSRFHLAFIVAIIAAADIGAYFSGKAFGRHKLAPSISPGKTWEGFAGGVLAAGAVAGIVALALPQYQLLPLAGFLCLSLACACISVVGDLYESMIKRDVGAKDSGDFLPGHGGVLDRIDGLIAAVTLYSFVLIHSGY